MDSGPPEDHEDIVLEKNKGEYWKLKRSGSFPGAFPFTAPLHVKYEEANKVLQDFVKAGLIREELLYQFTEEVFNALTNLRVEVRTLDAKVVDITSMSMWFVFKTCVMSI